jgi:lysine 6-dehydrogenase
VPYFLNVELSKAAIAANCHFCDLGGNTDVVFEQHALNADARNAGVTIAPDCGLAPGMGNILAVYGMCKTANARRVKIRVGGLPQKPEPPLDYFLFFNIEGLTNEYFGRAVVLRNGKRTEVDTFTELETIDFPQPVGRCEAFMTYGGTSTCPWTFEGVLDEFDEKTVRYPGHYEKMKTIYQLGLLDQQPVEVAGQEVIPRDLFHTVVEPRLKTGDPRDVVVLRVIVSGENQEMVLDLMDHFDQNTGFSAMQRTTGFGAAIVGIMLARGELPAGCIRLETEIDPGVYVAEMTKRGFDLRENCTQM